MEEHPAEDADISSIVSISSVLTFCFKELNALLELAHKQHNDGSRHIVDIIQEELGRLRLWAGNFGAHRKPTDRLSLDHRLREAQKLHKEVRDHLHDIGKSAQNARDIILSFGQTARGEHGTSASEDSDSDSFWEELRDDEDVSDMEELLLDIGHAITSLYKFSITLQNPAHRDRSKQAARIDKSHYLTHDIQHASDKFGLPKEDPLIQRLGKANTTRRQILEYHKDHSGKISNYIDVVVDKAAMLSRDLGACATSDKQLGSDKSKSMAASTNLTQNTSVSTIRQANVETNSDSGRTIFSSASSTNDNQQPPITIPPPPDPEDAARGVPFICPYCVQPIQLENIDDDWRYHVYSDLRPYVCTFPNCKQETRLFDSYTEWSDHELQFHRREWACHICAKICDTQVSFTTHLQDAHSTLVPPEQLTAIVRLSSRPRTSPQKCPLCTKPPVSASRRFQQHLARHLQELSLFVLPRVVDDEYDEDRNSNQSPAANESQRAYMSDDEDRYDAATQSEANSDHVLMTPGGSRANEFDYEDFTKAAQNLKEESEELNAIDHPGIPTSRSNFKHETFQCIVCSNHHVFRDRGSFRRHIVDRHQAPEIYRCPFCADLETGRRDKARLHLAQRHGVHEPTKEQLNQMAEPTDAPYQCEVCEILYDSWQKYFDCIRNHCHAPLHRATDSSCDDDSGGDGYNYNGNGAWGPDKDPLFFGELDNNAAGFDLFAPHSFSRGKMANPPVPQGVIPENQRFQCAVCPNGYLFSRGAFQRHVMDLHQAPVVYSCRICHDLETGRRDKARRHLAQRHGVEPTKEELNQMAVPMDGPYTCEVCRILYNSWENYFECIWGHCIVVDNDMAKVLDVPDEMVGVGGSSVVSTSPLPSTTVDEISKPQPSPVAREGQRNAG